MIVGQVRIALLLATAASLLMRSASSLNAVDPGVTVEGAWFGDVSRPAVRYQGYTEVRQFYQDFLTRLEGYPGVERAAVVSLPPLCG